MKVIEKLEAAKQFLAVINSQLDGLSIPAEPRERISIALFQLTIEHFNAAIVLLDSNLGGSAAALVRLQYEAFIRGLYFWHVASDAAAKSFIEGRDPPKIKQMIDDLEKLPLFSSGALSSVHVREWIAMNSFTHGGSTQVKRRFNQGNLVGDTTESEIEHILKACQYTAYGAAFMVAGVCQSSNAATNIADAHKRLGFDLWT
jgi:hypothetical protein